MAKCDLCNRAVPAHSLVQLRDIYKIPGVTDICSDCDKWATKTKGALIDQIAPEMRKRIEERKAEYEGPRKESIGWRIFK
jgi:hypothetical protein